ncbi:hypothetical protein POG22_08175, partial [Geitlerinema sp. CS-897]|nr:hypothetical protein [Geitlerinema sp. CS-897]
PIEKLKNLGFSSAITDSIGKLESKTTIGQAVRHQNSLWRLIQQALSNKRSPTLERNSHSHELKLPDLKR